eukprot:g5530.t1
MGKRKNKKADAFVRTTSWRIVVTLSIICILHVSSTASPNDADITENINCSGEHNLREGWFEYFSDEEDRPYFYNANTEETTWTYPYEKCSSGVNKLPPYWKRSYSEDVGEYYYVNTKTSENQWLNPVDGDRNKSPMHVIVDTTGPKPSEKLRKTPKKKRARLSVVYVAEYGSFVESCGKSNRPCGGIQQAINRAADHAKIYVQPGRYSGPGNFLLNFEGKSIDLISSVDKEAVIDCENRGPVVNPLVPSGHLQISGFRIVDCPMTKQGTQLTGIQHMSQEQQQQLLAGAAQHQSVTPGSREPPEIFKIAAEYYRQQMQGNM